MKALSDISVESRLDEEPFKRSRADYEKPRALAAAESGTSAQLPSKHGAFSHLQGTTERREKKLLWIVHHFLASEDFL